MIQFEKSRLAGKKLQKIVPNKINRILNEIADELHERSEEIITKNILDLASISANSPVYDQLQLDKEKLENASDELREIASLPTLLGKILSSVKRPNGMIISKIVIPYGVIGVIYESRPLFTIDSFALCIKSGNAVVLRSSKEAHNTNEILTDIIKRVLKDNGIDHNAITLLDTDNDPDFSMLRAIGDIDIIIPRGNNSLVDFVRDNTKIPVISTDRGVCHTYIDAKADPSKAASIIYNAKTRLPIACNSIDCMIIHREQLENLESICAPLKESDVKIYADEDSYKILEGSYAHLEHSSEKDYSTEFLANKIAIKTVSSLEEALNHIDKYSSKHSEAIITEDQTAAKQFLSEVDAACVYHNVSTSFTDGAQFGMGAEIGISTQKTGVRGPISFQDLTTYKYIVTGDNQIRQ